MGRKTNLRDLIGLIKDKVSLSKASILSGPTTLSLRLAVIRATTHAPSTPPDYRLLTALLSLGDSSRSTAAALVEALMDRLHRTGDSAVAAKCLFAVHHIIKRGPFILQDQLSVFPSSGGRNYLNLSSFKDNSTAATWALSAWVRWYARYLETLLSASRTLGFVLCSSSSSVERETLEESLSSSANLDLFRDVDSLVGVIEELCRAPESLLLEGNRLLDEVISLLGTDYLSSVNEISLRLGEFKERLPLLSFGESVDLERALKRLADCRDRLSSLFSANKPSIDILWESVAELRGRVGIFGSSIEGRKLGTMDKGSESTRFGDRVLNSSDSVRFSSGRFSLNTPASVV